MTLTLESAAFNDIALGVSGARSADGSALSLVFDRLEVESQPSDPQAAPQMLRAKGLVRCEGSGRLSVQVRATSVVVGAHSLAQVMVWANGSRIALLPALADEPLTGAMTARVGNSEELLLSLVLLAQRDPADAHSAALCRVESIDVAVLGVTRHRHAMRR